MRKIFLCFLIISCIGLSATAQPNNTFTNIVSKLTAFSVNHATEKSYLQFDKPYYAGGDTLYYKAYVTTGERHQPTNISGALHVDFINLKNEIEQSATLQIDSGVCWGDFALPDSLPAGNYRMRAYTQWMRNNGEKDFFEKNISIGSLKKNDTDSLAKQPLPTTQNKPDLQFFPEGSNLVVDIPAKVAFKAIASTGLAINVKGVIVDKQNKQVATFASTHAGMGYFFLTPTEGNQYQAKITFADGTQNVVDLPTPLSSGASISIDNSSDAKASITVMVNNAFYHANQNKDFFLLFYSSGTIVTAPFTLDANVISLHIAKRQLHTGVTRATLFSTTGEPLCERLFFVQNHDALTLHITTDKTEYFKRDKVTVLLSAKDAAGANSTGHFSVSVIDESLVPTSETDEATILTHLLLTSELKGYVEQPNYYFTDTCVHARNDLDVLMLTQGYRGFEWKQVFDSSHIPLAYLPEKGFDISGKVTSLSGKPLENADINLLPEDGGFVLSRTTDDEGLFHFSNLQFTDTFHFILNAANAKGRNLTKITYYTDKHPSAPPVTPWRSPRLPVDTAMQVYVQNAKNYRNININYDNDKSHFLKPVTVKTTKKDDQYRTSSLAGAGHADQVMHADEIEQIGGQLATSLNGRLRGIVFGQANPSDPTNSFPYLRGLSTGPMLVILDGAEVNATDKDGHILPYDINQIPSTIVETVEVLKYASASMYGIDAGNGVLIITTKQGEERFKGATSFGVLSAAAAGFYKARTFYSPKYDYKNKNSKQPDLRSTIYWNPEIRTDKDGNASMDFYNADGTGTYKVIIEGMDNYGNIGSEVYRYKVQ